MPPVNPYGAAPMPPPPAAAPAGGPLQTQQIYIPNDLVGSIIGKGGSKINEIRQMSASQIKIMEPGTNANGQTGAPGGSETERLVVITGAPANIQMAVQMLYTVCVVNDEYMYEALNIVDRDWNRKSKSSCGRRYEVSHDTHLISSAGLSKICVDSVQSLYSSNIHVLIGVIFHQILVFLETCLHDSKINLMTWKRSTRRERVGRLLLQGRASQLNPNLPCIPLERSVNFTSCLY